MNKQLRLFCITEFSKFEQELLTSWQIDPDELKSISPSLKSLHKSYLGFATLCSMVTTENKRSSYIASAPEACLLSIVMMTKGLENPSHVMMRQCIELTLKHIYFSTHPVEYKWSQERIDYREINFQFLLGYIRKCDETDIIDTKESFVK